LKVRIASVSIVKDEADILEAFVRHNLVFIDRMFIIDDQSSDNTSEILRRLALENPSVTLLDDGWNGAFHQKKRTTAALNLVRKIEDWDCVLALDADEFISTDARSTFETEIRAIPPASSGGFRAVHYCIHGRLLNPTACQNQTCHIGFGIFKSFLTRELLQIENLAFSDGNHHILVNGALLENTWPLPSVVLAHFPVRSMDQIAIKLLRQYVGWLSRADYVGHLRMSVNAALALKDEPSFALGHSSKVFPLYFNFVPNHIDLGERPFRERQGVVKWPELAVSPPYAQLMGLLDGWISRLSAIDHLSMFSVERSGRRIEARRQKPSPRRTLDFETFSRGRRKKLSCNYFGRLEAFLEETFFVPKAVRHERQRDRLTIRIWCCR
jgi:hypothetical protein